VTSAVTKTATERERECTTWIAVGPWNGALSWLEAVPGICAVATLTVSTSWLAWQTGLVGGSDLRAGETVVPALAFVGSLAVG